MSRSSREARAILDSQTLPPDQFPPYSGPDMICPKCGNRGANTRYYSHGRCIHGALGPVIFGLQPNERLHRECSRCDYSWDEALAT